MEDSMGGVLKKERRVLIFHFLFEFMNQQLVWAGFAVGIEPCL